MYTIERSKQKQNEIQVNWNGKQKATHLFCYVCFVELRWRMKYPGTENADDSAVHKKNNRKKKEKNDENSFANDVFPLVETGLRWKLKQSRDLNMPMNRLLPKPLTSKWWLNFQPPINLIITIVHEIWMIKKVRCFSSQHFTVLYAHSLFALRNDNLIGKRSHEYSHGYCSQIYLLFR